MRVLIIDPQRSATRACLALDAVRELPDVPFLTAGGDVSDDRIEINIFAWQDGEPIAWELGDIKGLLVGAYARCGWASRCLDPATGLWETFRLSRRAARRQRGRARGAARLARRRGIA